MLLPKQKVLKMWVNSIKLSKITIHTKKKKKKKEKLQYC